MIKDAEAWKAWEDERKRSTPIDVEANFRAFASMLDHARKMGAFPPANPLDGIEHKIALAKALNALAPRDDRTET